MRTTLRGVEQDACFLCAANNDTANALPWYDRPVLREPGTGAAVSAVGALTPGYLVVAPARHTRSVRDLPPDSRAAFLDFTWYAKERVEAVYGVATVFEHGSCRNPDGRRSACVAHSHIHIVPGRYGLDALDLPTSGFGSVAELLAAASADRPADGYLMYQEPGGPARLAADVGISQFFRRHIAAVLGEPDGWDYAVFPRWDNVLATQVELVGPAAKAG